MERGGVFKITNRPAELTIAKWRDRALAWLVDFVIVSAGISVIYAIWNSTIMSIHPSFHFTGSIAFFAYWIILESKSGQSIGKMLLGLKTTRLNGKQAGHIDIMIASFGKAFLLPIDLFLGWLFTTSKRQRLFNRLSSTIVIKIESQQDEVSYKID